MHVGSMGMQLAEVSPAIQEVLISMSTTLFIGGCLVPGRHSAQQAANVLHGLAKMGE